MKLVLPFYPMRWLACIVLGAALAGAAFVPGERPAEASVSVPISFDTLVGASSAVVVATAEEQRTVWEDAHIFTYSRVHVDTAIAGELKEDGEAWVKTMGGVVAKVGQVVDGEPVFLVGRPSLVFLHHKKGDTSGVFLVTARGQGQYGIYTDDQNQLRLRRSSAVGALVPSASASTDPKAPLAGDVIHGRALADAASLIRAVWGPEPKPSK
jgi:hypothetical protein